MASSFFFYDLETSGLSSSYQRIMQFAGQRTDSELKPIGEPINVLVKLSEDILPEPDAVMITKTTPQKTLEEGISEPELVRLLTEQVFTPDTIIVGFNNIRFDDEFLRSTLWRNFYDPYEWSYRDNRSRWDMLDVVRMTRALRPDGIIWPVDKNNQPTNRLEELASANKLGHDQAHDALSDVTATIALARLIKQKQPKLFNYLLGMRHKSKVAGLVNLTNPQAFVYASGRYGKAKSFTTIGFPIAPASRDGGVVVYDLTVDPKPLLKLTTQELKAKLFATREERQRPDFQALPVKELFYNKAPAVAPIGVMDDASWERLGLDKTAVMEHSTLLEEQTEFTAKLTEVFQQKPPFKAAKDVEGQLYDGFVNDKDKPRLLAVRSADEKTLAHFKPDFADERLDELYLRYKGRNFPKILQPNEQEQWETYRKDKFLVEAPKFMARLSAIAAAQPSDNTTQFLIEELRLWAEMVAPADSQ